MKILINTVLFLTFVGFTALAAYPCTCEIMKPSKKLGKAKSVFIGEVVEIGSSDKSEWATVSVKFKVEIYWKGVKQQFITVVGAPAAAGACGLPVEIGKKYLIYAFNMGEGQLETDFCASRWLDRATEDLAFLGKGKKLKSKP